MLLVPVKAPAVGKPMSGAIRLAIGSMVEWFDCAADDLARQIQAGVLNSGNNGAQAGSHVLSLSLSLSLSLHELCHLARFAFYRSSIGLRYVNSTYGLSL